MNQISTISYISETVFRGALASSACVAALVMTPTQIGMATLAGSIGFIFSGISNASWANRLQTRSKYPLDSNLAIREFSCLTVLTFVIFIPFCFLVRTKFIDFKITLILISVITYILANLSEILWGIIGLKSLNLKLSLIRLSSIAFGAFLGLCILIIFKNSFSLLLVQFLIWSSVVLFSVFSVSINIRKILATSNRFRFWTISADTKKIVLTNSVINISMVVDNLILGGVKSSTEIATYSMAFGICSLFVTVVGSTYQRLYSIRKDDFHVESNPRGSIKAAILLFCLFGLISFATKNSQNVIFHNSPRIVLLLIPSIFYRIQTAKYSAAISRFGDVSQIWKNSITTILLLAVFGIPSSIFFGAYGMAAATSFSYALLNWYLKIKVSEMKPFSM